MARPLLDDELWKVIAPLIPPHRTRRGHRHGRAPIPDRAVLTGILYVLRSGVPWQMLPKEMGCGSGSTSWRRLVRWEQAGVWRRLHERLLAELRRGRRPTRATQAQAHQGDRAYWSQARHARLAAQGIVAVVAKPRSPHGSGLGIFRWVVERTLAWLHRFRRLAVRYERRDDVHGAFLTLGCALITWNCLKAGR